MLGTWASLILASVLFTIWGTVFMERVFLTRASRVLPPKSVTIQAVGVQGELGARAPRVFSRVEVAFCGTVFMEWIIFTRATRVLPGELLAIGRTIGMGGEL